MIASLIRYNIRVAIKKLHEFAAYLNLDLPPELLPKPIRKAKDEAKLVAAKDALIELCVAAPRPPDEVPPEAPAEVPDADVPVSEVPAEVPSEVPAEAPADAQDAEDLT